MARYDLMLGVTSAEAFVLLNQEASIIIKYQDHILITIINMIMIITSVEAFVLLNKEVFMSIRLYIDDYLNHDRDHNS